MQMQRVRILDIYAKNLLEETRAIHAAIIRLCILGTEGKLTSDLP